jgi:hypothetical protein
LSEPVEPRRPRVFSLEEAKALLPTLRGILSELREARSDLTQVQAQLAERLHVGSRGNGHVVPGGEVDRLNGKTEDAQERIRRAVLFIAELGCELKDPDRGMVDFRWSHEGRIVYLCWLAHEETIQFWHELEGGYRGRQPLEQPGQS